MNNLFKGSLALATSRVIGGLNVNCTKFLLPLWITPMGYVTLRLLFGTAFFWLLAIFDKPDTSSTHDKVRLLLLGAVAVFGYMSLYAVGMSYTTPVNFAIFNATQPIWVFIISVFLHNERVTKGKVCGILMGFGGVVAASLASPVHDLASDRFLGNSIALVSALCYSIYLICSAGLLRRVSNLVMLRYTFLGATFSALSVSMFTGFSTPMFITHFNATAALVFLLVLIFPTVVSYLLVPIGIKYLKTTLVAIYGYISLVVATVVSLLLGQDRFDIFLLIALLLICGGIYLVSVSERVRG
ncbi:MAG: DMT family transporter [Bacteroidaceae bacterium]|nr:DMT family transporter [Bacteroidaceae bacterium]